jgi:tripartite-type tricarboxylate transporter receptor subunit TctC
MPVMPGIDFFGTAAAYSVKARPSWTEKTGRGDRHGLQPRSNLGAELRLIFLDTFSKARPGRGRHQGEVPSFDGGYDSVVGSAWNGIVTPAGTPPDVVSRLNDEISQVLGSPETKERFTALGMEAVGGSAESFARFLQAETQKRATVIRTAHIQAQ